MRQTNSPNLREAQQHTDEVECARVLEAKGLSARTQRFLLPDVERSFIVPSCLHRTHVGKANLDDHVFLPPGISENWGTVPLSSF